MNIPEISQLPLYEPIYGSNGQLSPVWAAFFESILQLLNNSQMADLIELLQLASQLPDQSKQGQVSIDLGSLLSSVGQVQIHKNQDEGPIPITPASHPTHEIIPTTQSVFLCPEAHVDLVQIQNVEVITP